ncbi:MAG: hypothetical protein BGO30_08185 [Bacteroidetes bacterium 41-46]|nr:MAG: hypothetical protein BGO30_08185 [Bacteroidetes bacterium 41-46]
MATILQSPDQYSFVGNIKNIIVSTNSQIVFQLKYGSEILIDSSYIPDLNDKVEIDIEKIVKDALSSDIPESGEITTRSFQEFSFKIGSGLEQVFYAFEGGVDTTISPSWFAENFLTWQPQTSYVTWNQPQFLSYIALAACSLKVKGYFADGTNQTILFGALAANKVNTANLQYSSLPAKFSDKQPAYIDVWTENASGQRLSYIQRFVLKNTTADDNCFLFKNSLGAWDSVVFTGAIKNEASSDVKTFTQDDTTHEYQVDLAEKYYKNTGYLLSDKHRIWISEFFKTNERYFLSHRGYFEKLTVLSSTINSQKSNPSSYNFTFSLSRSTKYLNLPRVEAPEAPLEIVDPAGELFFLAPRLSEFTSAEFVDEFILPVQSPYEQSWKKMSLGALKQGILNSISEITSPLAHTHTWESITGKPLAFTPSAHNHDISEVVSLSNALSSKEPGLGNPQTDGQILASTVAGVRSWVSRYVLPVATAAVLGGVMVGTGLNANAQGVLSHSDFSIETGIGGALGHIKASERTAWNSHKDDSDKHLSVEERAYFNKLKTYLKFAVDNSSMYSTLNFYSESGVSAFGIGTGGSSGGVGVNVINDLVHSAYNSSEVLSAYQGYVLKGLIDTKSSLGHTHSWSEITNKPATFTPSTHSHTKSQITDFAHTHLWADITDKPTSFTPSAHSHNDLYYTETEIANFFSGTVAIAGYNKSNWDTAHGWGNHASAGYASASALNNHINNTSLHLSVAEREYLTKLISYLKISADNSSMYSTLNFYSESGVSAFGIGSGSSSGGGADLYNGLDKNVPGMALDAYQGYVLMGLVDSKEPAFVKNTAFNKSFGASAGMVAEGNHTHTFASLTSKPTTVDGYYISDAIYFNQNIDITTNNNYRHYGYGYSGNGWVATGAALTFGANGSYYALIQATQDNIWYNYTYNGAKGAWRSLWHSGNFNPSSYLPLTGGTISGGLTLTGGLTSNGTGAPYWVARQLGISRFLISTYTGIIGGVDNDANVGIYNYGAGNIGFWTNGSKRMELLSTGILMLGANSVYHSGNLLNIGTSASTARTALGLGSMSTEYVSSFYTKANINTFFFSDTRTITPQTWGVATLQFGFTSMDLNNGSPYADFMRFGGYEDSSGGRKNIILFKKSEFGIRQYQGDFASATYNHGYVDYWHTGNLTNTLSNGYLPYWNNGSLANTPIIYSSNLYLGARTLITDWTNSIQLGQWDEVNNRIESLGRPLYITSYTEGVKMGYAGNIDLTINSSRNIGIGYTNRYEKFAVNGSGYFNSHLSIGGSHDVYSQVFINSTFGTTNNAALRLIYQGSLSGLGEVAMLAHRNSQWSLIYGDTVGSSLNWGLYIQGNKPNYLGGALAISGAFSGATTVVTSSYIESSSYLKGTSVKIGANWEAIPNGSDLELKYGGVLKAKLDPSGNITAVGGITCFAI